MDSDTTIAINEKASTVKLTLKSKELIARQDIENKKPLTIDHKIWPVNISDNVLPANNKDVIDFCTLYWINRLKVISLVTEVIPTLSISAKTI